MKLDLLGEQLGAHSSRMLIEPILGLVLQARKIPTPQYP